MLGNVVGNNFFPKNPFITLVIILLKMFEVIINDTYSTIF